MSLVAVVTRPGDRPGELPETRVVPVGMAQDTVFGAYFLNQTSTGGISAMCPPAASLVTSVMAERAFAMDSFSSASTADSSASTAEPEGAPSAGLFQKLFSRPKAPGKRHQQVPRAVEVSAGKARSSQTAEDILLDLASRMDSDGGMPGKNRESRASATVIALLAFLSQGHTDTRGAFRSHVGRLVSFLKSLTSLPSLQQQIVDAVIELAYRGTAPVGEWITLAHTPGNHWYEVERSVLNA